MPGFQFTLAQLLGIVMIGALICGTLVLLLPSGVAITLLIGAPAIILESAILGVILGRGLTRQFWSGFQQAGWLSFAVVVCSSPFWSIPVNHLTEVVCADWAASLPNRNLGWICHWLEFGLPFAILVLIPILCGCTGGHIKRKKHMTVRQAGLK